MNISRMKKLIKNIEKAKYFNQHKWSECGTPGCVAGHAAAMRPDFVRFVRYNYIEVEGGFCKHLYARVAASDYLELDEDMADMIFDSNFVSRKKYHEDDRIKIIEKLKELVELEEAKK